MTFGIFSRRRCLFDGLRYGIANGSPLMPLRDRVDAMASENTDQPWPLRIVRLIVYAAIAIAVGYAIAHFWPAYYWPH